MKLNTRLLIACLASVAIMQSCKAPKDISYLQNVEYGKEEVILNVNEIKVRPYDKLSIIVSCKEPELAQLFNLVTANRRVGASSKEGSTVSGDVSVYTVDSEGSIEFPVLGKIHVAGLNREQISSEIATALKDGKWISDPVVSVEFTNLHFSVLGEVNSPGTYPITNDNMTLLEALATAGDLKISGKRAITVMREQDGRRTAYEVNLEDKDLYNSPVYYMRQNDVIYVRPSDLALRQAQDNPNDLRSVTLWTSICSMVTAIMILIIR